MRLVRSRTTPRVLVVKNLINDHIYQKSIPDLWRRSRTHESHLFENRKITQTYEILKYKHSLQMIKD